MGRSLNIGFDKIIEERKMLSFFKFFQTSDLSSESMRAFSYSFISSLSRTDFSDKMVIRAQWGKTWHVEISKNPRYYYIEKRGWDQFVSDNALGENELIIFTHRGNMVFHINIYEQNGVEMLTPRGIKKEGESSFKDVKKEEETDESAGRAEFVVRKRKTEESKSSKKKMERKKVKNGVETGESSRGSELKARKKRAEGYNTSKKKKSNSMSKEVLNGVPKFKVTISKYLRSLNIPKHFADDHIPNNSSFTVRHPNGIGSWKVLCLVGETQTIFSGGYTKLAREYPLMAGDKCTFKLIKPFEFVLTSKKAVLNGVPEFKVTLSKSYRKFQSIPKHFADDHLPNKSKIFTVRHPNGIGSWKVLCLVRETRTIFSGGYTKLAREYPLMVGDKCTFKLIKPFEFVLLTSKKEVLNGVPEFKVTIRNSYLWSQGIPKHFVDDHIPNKSKFFTVRHPNGIDSWKVRFLVRGNRTVISGGFSKLAREYPLMVGDKCTYKLIKPFEFVLLTSKKTREDITT